MVRRPEEVAAKIIGPCDFVHVGGEAWWCKTHTYLDHDSDGTCGPLLAAADIIRGRDKEVVDEVDRIENERWRQQEERDYEQAITCQQCGTRDKQGYTHEEHGYLCGRCAYRQTIHDDRRDGIEH